MRSAITNFLNFVLKMRAPLHAIAIFFFLQMSTILFGQVIRTEASKVAEEFLSNSMKYARFSLHKNSVPKVIETVTLTNSEAFVIAYIAHLEPTGFIVVSPVKELQPVISYSYRHSWNSDAGQANIFYQLLKTDLQLRLNNLMELPKYVRNRNEQLWRDYLDGNTNHVQGFQQWPEFGTTLTGGWIETIWNQLDPFNQFCPIDPDVNQRSVVGCSGTAMAQILNFHQCFGDKRFSSADSYTTNNPDIQIDADSSKLYFPSFTRLNRQLDTLQYKYDHHLPLNDRDRAALSFASGIMINTYFSVNNSGAYTNQVAPAFTEKMNYLSADFIANFNEYYNILIDNMKKGLPAQISVKNPEIGHAIVCDGYNTDDFFHINFGWGEGSPTTITDAWYSLPYGLPMDFTVFQNAVVNIKPSLDAQSQLAISDSLIEFSPVPMGATSDVISCTLRYAGSSNIVITELTIPSPFKVSLDGENFNNQFDDLILPAKGELRLYINFAPDSVRKYQGEMELIISGNGVKRYAAVDLLGFGAPERGTVITENLVSGTWDKSNSPYYIVDHVSVAAFEKLTIEPGSKVLVQNPWQFEIGPHAQLIAMGNEQDSIWFSAHYSEKGWEGLEFIDSGDDDTLAFCVVSNGKSLSHNGGAIHLESTNLNIKYSTFLHNLAETGGALYAKESSPILSHSTFKNNSAQSGGTLYLFKSNPQIENCIFESNNAMRGGAICSRDSFFPLTKSEFVHNNAELDGGVIFSTGSRVTIENCIFRSNSAQESGDLLSCRGSKFFLQNITTAKFTVSVFSDFISLLGTSYVEIKNSILWQDLTDVQNYNPPAKRSSLQFLNPVTDTLKFHYNDIDSVLVKRILTDISPFALKWGHYNLSADPQFRDVENNDFRLKEYSPCIDAGDPSDDVGDESFPHGHRRNLGAYGGTVNAAQTSGPSLTVSPDPIDFGELATYDIQELTVYLKNGSASDINITGIFITDSTHFEILASNLNEINTLTSGGVDSFKIQFKPPLLDEQMFNPKLVIRTAELEEKQVPIFAHLLTGTPIEGYVSGVLKKENSPYIVEGDLEIPPDKNLFIEPGVHLKFHGMFGITVPPSCQFRAIGSPNDSIRFSAVYLETGWRGIKIYRSNDNDTLAYCVIQDVNITKAIFRPFSGAFSSEYSSSVITDCRFHRNRGRVISCFGFYNDYDLYTTISNCLIENNSHLVDVLSFLSLSATIENTIIQQNSSNYDILWFSGSNKFILNLVNVTFVQNYSKGQSIYTSSYLEHPQESVFIKNSIFWNNHSEVGTTFEAAGAIISIEYCDIDTSSESWFYGREFGSYPKGSYNWKEGNICLDPLFTNPENGDLTLSENSPCIDAGNPDPIFNDVEDPANPGYALWPAMGTVRNDMGAYGGGVRPYQTSVLDLQNEKLPMVFALSQNYPNPFNSSTTIKFTIPNRQHVTLKIYNVMGQLVDTLVEENIKEGGHKVIIEAKNYSSGMYVIVLRSGHLKQVKKMLFLK
jgi:hypothetical protein